MRRGHDDLRVSAALCGVLEAEPWGRAESVMIPAPDILDDPDWCVDMPYEPIDDYDDDIYHGDYPDERRSRRIW